MANSVQVRSYLNYWLDAVDSHSLHSPYFYDFYTQVLKPKTQILNTSAEVLRQKLLQNDMEINVHDLGAGSAVLNGAKRRIKDIARVSLTPARFSALYSRIILYQQCKTIIELGTSLGINTLYLAADKTATVTTFEGSAEIAEIARDTFTFAEGQNIGLVEGDISKTLPDFLMKSRKVDFVFMDANHRYQPTINYFHALLTRIQPSSVVVVDDIHYSEEMEKAWHEMKVNQLVYGSADLYRAGILFFDPSLNKQHVVLQF